MKKHAFLSASHSTQPRAQADGVLSCGHAFVGLTGLLLLGGCNKTPAPAAPAAEPATTAQAAPPPPLPRMHPRPLHRRPRCCRSRTRARPRRRRAARLRRSRLPRRPQEYVVPAGTPLVVRMGQTVSAKNSNVGDTFHWDTGPVRGGPRSQSHPRRCPGHRDCGCRQGAGKVQGRWRPGHSDQPGRQLLGHHHFL